MRRRATLAAATAVGLASAVLVVPPSGHAHAPDRQPAGAPTAATAIDTATAAVPAARKRTRATLRGGTRLRVDVNPNLPGDGSYRIRLQKRRNGEWQGLRTVRTRGRAETRSFRVRDGRYRVRVLSQRGYAGSTSRPLTYRKPWGIDRISTNSAGQQANDWAQDAAAARTQPLVAFSSAASNLGSGQDQANIFVKNVRTGSVEWISKGILGAAPNGPSYLPDITPDGRWVVFESLASNIVPLDRNGLSDIFLVDRNGAIPAQRVSTDSGGGEMPSTARYPKISPSGQLVSWTSIDGAGRRIYVKNLLTGVRILASANQAGVPANGRCLLSAFSPDSTKLAMECTGDNLVPNDTNAVEDIFIKDLNTGAVTRASVAFNNVEANGASFDPVFGPNGRYLYFASHADNLVPGDDNSDSDVFRKDLRTGAVALISQSSSGVQGNEDSFRPAVSWDGKRVAFQSEANNLAQGAEGGNRTQQVFVRNTSDNTTFLASASRTGQKGNDEAEHPVFFRNRQVLFDTEATNLVAPDPNGDEEDILRKRLP